MISKVWALFDGHINNDDGTIVERLRRTNKNLFAEIFFDKGMSATVAQGTFLANDNNISRLIDLLKMELVKGHIDTQLAVDDADLFIMKCALEPSSKTSVIVSDVSDILVLITVLTPARNICYYLKVGKTNTPTQNFSLNSLKYYSNLREHILFSHVAIGCDTTSCLFSRGKKSFFKSIKEKLKKKSKQISSKSIDNYENMQFNTRRISPGCGNQVCST